MSYLTPKLVFFLSFVVFSSFHVFLLYKLESSTNIFRKVIKAFLICSVPFFVLLLFHLARYFIDINGFVKPFELKVFALYPVVLFIYALMMLFVDAKINNKLKKSTFV